METHDYSNLRDPEFARVFDNWLDHMKERYERYDKLIKELEEAPKQLDLFKDIEWPRKNE